MKRLFLALRTALTTVNKPVNDSRGIAAQAIGKRPSYTVSGNMSKRIRQAITDTPLIDIASFCHTEIKRTSSTDYIQRSTLIQREHYTPMIHKLVIRSRTHSAPPIIPEEMLRIANTIFSKIRSDHAIGRAAFIVCFDTDMHFRLVFAARDSRKNVTGDYENLTRKITSPLGRRINRVSFEELPGYCVITF